MVYLIMNDGVVKADGKTMQERIPFMDRDPQTTVVAAKMESPRLMKTHMPYGCLPTAVEAGQAKVTSISCRRWTRATRCFKCVALYTKVDAQRDKLALIVGLRLKLHCFGFLWICRIVLD